MALAKNPFMITLHVQYLSEMCGQAVRLTWFAIETQDQFPTPLPKRCKITITTVTINTILSLLLNLFIELLIILRSQTDSWERAQFPRFVVTSCSSSKF